MDPQAQKSPPSVEEEERGGLIIHVTTARGAIPLEGALVTVREYSEDTGDGRGDAILSAVSGRNGNTERLSLYAPASGKALSPSELPPYARYNLDVSLEGYRLQRYISLPIFSGITAIQPVDMIPLSENGTLLGSQDEEERFFETPYKNL